MGRFLAIVIVLVAIALAINSFLPQCEVPVPSGESEKSDALSDDVVAVAVPSADEAEEKASAETAELPSTETTTPASAVEAEPAQPKVTVSLESEDVLLGNPELTAGIPGEGQLTAEQIDAWLANQRNLAPLKPVLPLGLAVGAAEIKGLNANPLSRAKIELGRQLYFDTRLSVDNTISCASCHDPANGYAKDTQFGIGVEGQEGGRNSPVAYNRILSGPQFWDGRAESLEAQAVGPIANPIEMGNTHEACVETIQGIEGYQKQFTAIFEDGVTIDNVGRALASFERALVTGPAPWDYYQELATFEKAYADDVADLDELKEEDPELYEDYMSRKEASDAHPISESAARGGTLFFSDKAGCTACHVGANFTDEQYHNLGVGMAADEPDVGRFSETNDDNNHGAFKTPTVRNVSMTGPYMHDGSQKTLLEVVEWYAKGGHPNSHLSEKVKKLELSDQDKQDLVAFMAEGLLGELPQVEEGRLPE